MELRLWYRKILHFLLQVPLLDSKNTRRRKLLTLILLGSIICVIVVLLTLIILIFTQIGWAGSSEEITRLFREIILLLVGIVLIYILNRHVSGRLASILFLLLIIALAAVADSPEQVANGRGLLTFALPIVAASILLNPWASFVTAALSGGVVVIVGLQIPGHAPNMLALATFFLLALISWLATRTLEQTLKRAEFYADVLAHDIGNLNQIMLGYLHLLRKTEDRETIEENIKNIKRSIKESARLAESIQILKRIRSTSLEKLCLTDSLERSIEKIKNYFSREILVNYTRNECYISANAFLDHAFFSILKNAVEFTLHDPIRIDITVEECARKCNVHIRDYGLGISKEKRKDILKNLDTPSKRTGMGLYVAKEIFESYGGTLDIQGGENGTEVIISLPTDNSE